MSSNTYIYIFIMAAVSYAIRVLPMTVIRKEIKSTFIRSFLYYVPYVTLAVMTFPAITAATQSIYSGIATLVIGIIAAWKGFDLLKVAITCCSVVFILELFLI